MRTPLTHLSGPPRPRRFARLVVAAALVGWTVLLTAGPALAQEGSKVTRPWHYWIAPALLLGGIASLAAVGIRYYVKVVGGRDRR